jgi:hypothetical protein
LLPWIFASRVIADWYETPLSVYPSSLKPSKRRAI